MYNYELVDELINWILTHTLETIYTSKVETYRKFYFKYIPKIHFGEEKMCVKGLSKWTTLNHDIVIHT